MAKKKTEPKHNFECPQDMVVHVEKVLAGEYDFHMLDIGHPWRIADVGACCGDFSLWVRYKAETLGLKTEIDAFEPNPEALTFLRKNAEWIGCQVVPNAVFNGRKVKIAQGKSNLGEAHIVHGRGESVSVPSLKPSVLNNYDMIKMDVEGAEHFILTDDSFCPSASVIALEYHDEWDRAHIVEYFSGSGGWYLADGRVNRHNLGTLIFYSKEYGDKVKKYLTEKKNAA